MKAICTLLLGACLLCAPATANASDGLRSKVIGKWEVTVPASPVEVQPSFLVIREQNHAIVFDFQGMDIDIKEMKFTEKNGKLSAILYMGDFAKLVVWEENGTVKASVDVPMVGVLPLNLKKMENKP